MVDWTPKELDKAREMTSPEGREPIDTPSSQGLQDFVDEKSRRLMIPIPNHYQALQLEYMKLESCLRKLHSQLDEMGVARETETGPSDFKRFNSRPATLELRLQMLIPVQYVTPRDQKRYEKARWSNSSQ